MKPGLTGLWQVSGRGTGMMHLHTEVDLEYIDQMGPITDLKILLLDDPRHPAAQRQLAGVSAGEAHAQHGRSGSESMVSRRLEELDAGHPGHPLVRGDQPDPSAPKRELGPHRQRRGTGRGGTEHCDFAARTGEKGPVPRPGGG